jgi:hypothetical protein
VGFGLNPSHELGNLWVGTKSLCTGILARQLCFSEQGMNLFVAGSVHQDGDDTTSGFGDQVVCIL